MKSKDSEDFPFEMYYFSGFLMHLHPLKRNTCTGKFLAVTFRPPLLRKPFPFKENRSRVLLRPRSSGTRRSKIWLTHRVALLPGSTIRPTLWAHPQLNLTKYRLRQKSFVKLYFFPFYGKYIENYTMIL